MTIPRILPHDLPAPDTWPENRTSFRLRRQGATLLLHDLQQYFLDFFDRGRDPAKTTVRNAQALLGACRASGVPAIYTQQPKEQGEELRGLLKAMWGPGLAAAPERAAIEPSLAPREGEGVLVKWRYSAFQRTPLLGQLHHGGRKQLILCGVYAHIGCLATAMEAFMHDFEVFFVADAMADFSRRKHEMALECVASCCGHVVSTREVVEALTEETRPGSEAGGAAPRALSVGGRR